MEYGCIAEHLGHSFSREIHGELADYFYELREIPSDELERFMTERDFLGINVTIPYKERVIPYLSFIDEQAKEIGAVNTVVNRGGTLYGYNTDFYGMSALIGRMGVELQGRKVAVLGTGGTSRTARAVARALGAREILMVGRTPREGVISYEKLYASHSDVEFLINTTPLGMYPNLGGSAVELSHFPMLLGVADAVYNPIRTTLVLDARRQGIPAEGGLFMLVAQAVRASEIFLDTAHPVQATERVYQKILQQKENIVLIGMPGCGKSTVGALLAKEMGRTYCDLDTLIEQAAGKTIPELFADEGEDAFRDLETRVLKEELARRNGLIIATGGGAILRDENVDALRHNGRLYFLDRPVEELIPTDDRPLALDAEAILARYRERYSRYCEVADVQIKVMGDAAWVADAVRKEFDSL